ncbi:phosphotransferase [Candidatus Pacearchaeota archaeon]|nr:phosphotransferase [Candidatus Pacearchaeota archaeon]
MSEIKFDYKNGQFFLEGVEGERFECRGVLPINDFRQPVNFYRINNNFGYVQGRINFFDSCDNNVVVSDQTEITIFNAKNSFISINNGALQVLPISEVEIVCARGLDLLKNKKIIYNIPKEVLKRERLKRKSHGELEKILIENYRLHPVQLREIEKSAKKNGIFYVSDGYNKYVFKYIGEEEKRVEAISEVAKNISYLFPAIKETTDGKSGVVLEDGTYVLEEFIRGKHNTKRDLSYFTKLGDYMATMHEQLLILVENHPNLGREFLTDAKHLSESNSVALGIDLSLAGLEGINSEISQFVELELSKEIKLLPEYLIHGDLNESNVMVTPNGFRFIDLEKIKMSKRICELESPLIFGGNMAIPFYLEGSLKSIIGGYNSSAKSPLSDKERKLSIDLIKYALVKNFVIRNIRRGEKANTKENLLANLSLLSKEDF